MKVGGVVLTLLEKIQNLQKAQPWDHKIEIEK